MRIDIKKLRQDRAAKAARGKAALAEYNTLSAKADPTADDATRLGTLNAELEALETEVADLEAQITAEETRIRRTGLFSTETPVPARSAARTVNEPGPGTAGFRNLAEFAVSVRSAITGNRVDPRLADSYAPAIGAAPANYEQNFGTAGEGFMVPPDFRAQIWNLMGTQNDLYQMATSIPTSSNAVFMAKDETTPWGSSGVQAVWRSEAAQLSASKIGVGQITVQLHELAAYVLATNEILDDAPMLNDKLTTQAARALSWKASDALIWGDGNGKPLGWQNANSLVVVAKESGQAASTVVVANLGKMLSRMLRLGGKPFWVLNPDVLPQLISLTIGNVPAWLPFNSPIEGSPWEGALLGHPVLFSEHAQSLTTQGDINLVNMDGYMLLNKAGAGIDFASSIHLFFDYNISAFRWITRIGGQPYLSAAVTPANGSNTKSHFVTLAAR